MTFEVRPARDADEFWLALSQIGQYFGMERNDEALERFMKVLPLDRMHLALDGSTVVGGAGAFPFELSVPGGGSLPCCGTTVVGVSPTHRRRGVLTAMMRAQLDDAHERGEPLAALWASEAPIYGRFGFGLASWSSDMELAREYTAFHGPPPEGVRARLVEKEEALELFPPIWEAVRRDRPGMFSRSRDWWECRALADVPARREGAGPHRRVVFELDWEVVGYAIYRHAPEWDAGSASGAVRVVEALGTTPDATAAIWRYLLDIDWTGKITSGLLPPDHPLLFLVEEPRRLHFRLMDALWVRLLDVGVALAARSYPGDGPIVLEVADPFCPWNEGRWRVSDGGAERIDDEPDIRLHVRELGSAYLGGISFAQLLRARRIDEAAPGAARRADALFRWDAAPWCPEIF